MPRYRYAKLRGSVAALPDSGEGPLRHIQIVEGDIVDDGVLTHIVAGKDTSFTLAPGEVDRLFARGSFVQEGQPTGTERAIATARQSAAERNAKAVGSLDLEQLGSYDAATLAALWEAKPPTVRAVLAAVGDDAELAQRALDAELGAMKGDPRVTLQTGLDKVISGSVEGIAGGEA